MDVPFWPQLPNFDYREACMCKLPKLAGLLLDLKGRNVRFSMDKFVVELEETLDHFDDPTYFDISTRYSAVYHRFFRSGFVRSARDQGTIGRTDQFWFEYARPG